MAILGTFLRRGVEIVFFMRLYSSASCNVYVFSVSRNGVFHIYLYIAIYMHIYNIYIYIYTNGSSHLLG